MSRKNSDLYLEGYYRDPLTGRYFREKTDDAGNSSLKKLKKDREIAMQQSKVLDIKPMFSNVVKFLKAKECGTVSGLQAQQEFFKMATYNKTLEEEVSLNHIQNREVTSVEFLKGSKRSVFGVWNVCNSFTFNCIIGEKKFNSESLPNAGWQTFRPFAKDVVDMCEGPENTLIYTFNLPQGDQGWYHFLNLSSDSDRGELRGYTAPLYCISSTENGSTFAIGCIGGIRYYKDFPHSHLSSGETLQLSERIHAISFGESLNIIISATQNGRMYLHDVRQKDPQAEFKVSSNCITDSVILDASQVIVSGLDDMLCNVDLRMKKTVTQYLGHKTSLRKRSISIVNNLICASSADRTIRFWSLLGGYPVHEMPPANMECTNFLFDSMGWLYSLDNKIHLYQAEGEFMRRFKIV